MEVVMHAWKEGDSKFYQRADNNLDLRTDQL